MKIEEKIRLHLAAYKSTHSKTQKEMAEIVGVSYATYQQLEKGIVKKLDVLNKLKANTGFNEKDVYRKSFAADELTVLKKDIIELRAFVNVLLVEVSKFLTAKGKTFETKLTALQTKIDDEYARLYKEYVKEQEQDQE